MSVTREEDRQKNGCPSRGFGIAATAIGVGVGAALYYFFSKRAEHPNTEGSTSDWNCEQAFHMMQQSDDSYTTVSEYDTSDTSIYDMDRSVTDTVEDSLNDSMDLACSFSDSDDFSDSSSYDSSSLSSYSTSEESDMSEFDVTTSSLGIPEHTDIQRYQGVTLLGNHILWAPRVSPNRRRNESTEAEQMAMIRQEQFRERSWTLEECSICFDVMLRNQEVTRLSCAHNFHTECIMPWLQEKQTCPNCRKLAE